MSYFAPTAGHEALGILYTGFSSLQVLVAIETDILVHKFLKAYMQSM